MTQGTQYLYFKFHCNEPHPLLVIGLHHRAPARSRRDAYEPLIKRTNWMSIFKTRVSDTTRLPVHLAHHHASILLSKRRQLLVMRSVVIAPAFGARTQIPSPPAALINFILPSIEKNRPSPSHTATAIAELERLHRHSRDVGAAAVHARHLSSRTRSKGAPCKGWTPAK
jgi:hypothetical protein